MMRAVWTSSLSGCFAVALCCACDPGASAGASMPATAPPHRVAAAPAVVSAAASSSATPPAVASAAPFASSAELAVEMAHVRATTPRLVRPSSTACGGTVAAGANAQEAMLEALFPQDSLAYAHDGSLAVYGTLDYSEVAPAVTVHACGSGYAGGVVSRPWAFEKDDLVPIVPSAWSGAQKAGAFGVVAAHAFTRVLTTVPDPTWMDGADEVRILWVELTHQGDELARSSGLVAIVGRYGNTIKVLASAGGEVTRPSAQRSIPAQTVAGNGSFWVLLPHPDSGLTDPGDDEAWMRDIDKGVWRVAYVWKNGALKRTGVVPVSLEPNAERSKSWGARLLSTRYDATKTGLVGHESWRSTSGAEARMDRMYVLSDAELAKSYSAKILRPTSYAPPKLGGVGQPVH